MVNFRLNYHPLPRKLRRKSPAMKRELEQYETASTDLMRTYLTSIFKIWKVLRRRKLSFIYVSNCLNRGTDLNRLSISLSHCLKNSNKLQKYVSVVTCREVLEYYETSYFGEYQFVLFEHMSLWIKAYKIGNDVFLWRVFSSVNRWEVISNRAIDRVC